MQRPKPTSAPETVRDPLSGFLVITQAGYERHAAGEVGGGFGDWRLTDGAAFLAEATLEPPMPPGGWCFPQVSAFGCLTLRAPSVNALARSITDRLCVWLRGKRIETEWPCLFRAAAAEGLSAHAGAVEAEFRRLFRERMARVARLAVADAPRGPWLGEGLFVFVPAKGEAVLCPRPRFGGQRRMADDPAAPSRSYLKTEEAFVVLGEEPGPGQLVVDLGAAPGGWSYSAAKRGARVIAVDNGPLKGGALNHPSIEHLRVDAFTYMPEGRPDWLFCDIVEEPHHVWRMVRGWIERQRCRRFVVNLKFGRADPMELLERVRDSRHGLPHWCGSRWAVRHLVHDREEFTLVGVLSE